MLRMPRTLLEDNRPRSRPSAKPARAGPPVPAADRPELENAINAAALLWLTGESERACSLMEGLLAQAGDEPTLLNNLALSYLVNGRVSRALALLTRAARLAPGDRLIAANLARLRSRQTRASGY